MESPAGNLCVGAILLVPCRVKKKFPKCLQKSQAFRIFAPGFVLTFAGKY
jgi:hypothetical protein